MGRDKLRILWLKAGPLHPLDSGGKIRTYHMLRRIAMRHHVTYLALSPHRGDSSWTERANEYCHSLLVIPWREAPKYTSVFYHDLARNLILSSLPYAIEKYHSPALENFIRSRRPPEYDLLVCDFLAPSVNICRKPGLPSLLFQHNIESIIWERHYRTERNIWKRSYFRMQWKRMLRYEKAKCRCFDGILTVSSSDSDYLREEFGLDNVIGHVPTGVDIDYFRPMQGVRSRENHLVFTGSMDWLPNEDAVIYFVREIYPMIRAAVPDVTFTVAGRNPSSKLLSIGRSDPSVEVTGAVEDIRPYLASACALVVPLRIGGGTRIKIFEAMAMGIPVVSTSIGAEGLPVRDGKNILLADTAEIFAENSVRLLADRKYAKVISEDALEHVRTNFSWDAVGRVFESRCMELLNKLGVSK